MDFPFNDITTITKGDVIEDVFKNIKSKQIKLTFNKNQLKIINTWFRDYKLTYNIIVHKIRKLQQKYENFKLPSFYTIRNNTKLNFKTNKHILDEAIHDVIKAYKTAISNKKAKNISHFRIRYKKNCGTIAIPADTFSKKTNSLSKIKNIKSSESIIGINKTCRLKRNKNNFTLFVPIDMQNYKVNNRIDICGVDPGVRTFQTVYSRNGIEEYGNDISPYIRQTITKIEKLKKYQNKKWYKKYSNRLYSNIKNKVKDLHYKTAVEMVKKYDTIVIGKLSTIGIVRTNLNPLIKTTSYMLSHYKFRERLLFKASQYNCKVEVINEAYTSKTCGICRHINNVGSSKTYTCNYCNFTWDRDFNGARNILLKYILP